MNAGIVDYVFSSRNLHEALFVVGPEGSSILRESESSKGFFDDFGEETVRAAVLARQSTTLRWAWLSACPEARLAQLDIIDVVIHIYELPEGHSLVSIRPLVDYRALREQYAVARHALESIDGGLASFRLEMSTGLSTSPLATNSYCDVTGARPAELAQFGIPEAGSRVPASDRAVADLLLMNAILRNRSIYWPIRFWIDGKLVWRRFFCRNKSVDMKTAIIVAILRDYTDEAARLGMKDTPGVRETMGKDGEVEYEPIPVPGLQNDVTEDGANIQRDGSPSASTVSSAVSLSMMATGTAEDERGVRCPLSRCLKRKLLGLLGAVLDSKSNLENQACLISLLYPGDDPGSLLEEIILMLESDEQALLQQAFSDNNIIECSRILSTLLGTSDREWVFADPWQIAPTLQGAVCNVMISLHLLIYTSISAKDTDLLMKLFAHLQAVGSLAGKVSEAYLLINFALSVLALEAPLAWLSRVVSAAADAGDKCWDDPAVQVGMFWVTLEWARKQNCKSFSEALLLSCTEDLAAMLGVYPKSQLLTRLHAVASHNLSCNSK